MTHWIRYITVALVVLVVGCSSDGETGQAFIRAAHFAPEIPAVDICVDGSARIVNLAYGNASSRSNLTAGTYNLAVALVGGCGSAGGGSAGGAGGSEGPGIVLDLGEVTLEAGQDITVVAYRSGEEAPEPPVAVFFFDNSTEGLAAGVGRVLVGHGADDAALDRVDVVVLPTPAPAASVKQGAGGNGGSAGSGGAGGNGGDDCTVLIDDFEFGTQTPPPEIELQGGGSVTLAFNLESQETCPPFVPESGIEVPITANEVSILVAVDEDTSEGVDAELWALVGTNREPIPLIDVTPAPAQ